MGRGRNPPQQVSTQPPSKKSQPARKIVSNVISRMERIIFFFLDMTSSYNVNEKRLLKSRRSKESRVLDDGY
jgi:hypothetical protein